MFEEKIRAKGEEKVGIEKVREYGRKAIRAFFNGEKRREEERLVADFGRADISRGELTGHPEKRSEDTMLFDTERGVFGVFDGMGGVVGGAEASRAAAQAFAQMVLKYPPKNTDELREMVRAMSDVVRENPRAGGSTASVGQIVERNHQKYLLYAQVGDSRIYQIRQGEARQLTEDEGYQNKIWNYLGKPDLAIPQTGVVPLQKGDYLVFCSDGITGDFEKDFIPNKEIARIVERSRTASEAARNLTQRATKVDDRTALVVKM